MIHWLDLRRRGVASALGVLTTGLLVWGLLAVPVHSFSRQAILDAIRMVESGGRDDCPDGDAGLAIGPFQIHQVYWQDAVEADPTLGRQAGHDYEDCRRREYAERVVEAYMVRWVPEAWHSADAEVIARTHNGGPEGAQRSGTERYWRKVRARLARL